MLPAKIKSIISVLLVGGFIFSFPFENKLLLLGILLGPLFHLGNEINMKNDFFLFSVFEYSFVKVIYHPWINIFIIMFMWWGGGLLDR